MRSNWLSVAIAAALGVSSLAVAADPAPAQHKHKRASTSTSASSSSTASTNAEIEALKAQLTALQAQVAELQERTEAQSDINVSTGQAVEKSTIASTATEKKVTALEKAVNNTSLSGKMFFDFTNISEHNSDQNGKTNRSGYGIDVKRFYLGVTHQFNDIWSANLTTDFNYQSTLGQTSLFVKKAYVQGKFDDAAILRVGSADMPWIPFVENLYGYRYVENTLIDRLKYGNSADWGLHMSGDVANKVANYAVSVVNGGGFRNPSRSKGADIEARVGVMPLDNLTVAVGGYDGNLGKETQTVDALHTARRADALIAYSDKQFKFGGEYFNVRNWNQVLSPLADKADGYSFWGSVLVADGLSIFARYDKANLSKDLDKKAEDTYYNAGVEYQVTKGFRVAGVWKHEKANRTVATPVPTHVQDVKGNEVGVFGELSF